MALSPSTYVKDEQGATFIAASQRPDGTWRKPRRVRDGYIPQEEVPIYESKGRLFAKSKPSYPVGMTEDFVNAHKGKKENFEKAPISGIMVEAPSEVTGKAAKKKKKKKSTISTDQVCEDVAKIHLTPSGNSVSNKTSTESTASANSCGKIPSQSTIPMKNPANTQQSETAGKDPAKRIKNLRKKLREIEAIEEKIASGETKNIDKDQLEKVARKRDVLSEIEQLSFVLEKS